MVGSEQWKDEGLLLKKEVLFEKEKSKRLMEVCNKRMNESDGRRKSVWCIKRIVCCK